MSVLTQLDVNTAWCQCDPDQYVSQAWLQYKAIDLQNTTTSYITQWVHQIKVTSGWHKISVFMTALRHAQKRGRSWGQANIGSWQNQLFVLTLARAREVVAVCCFTSQQHACVSQWQICLHNCASCHTETEVADQTFYVTHSQYSDTVLTSSSTDLHVPGRVATEVPIFKSMVWLDLKKRAMAKAGIKPKSTTLKVNTSSLGQRDGGLRGSTLALAQHKMQDQVSSLLILHMCRDNWPLPPPPFSLFFFFWS